MIIIECYLNIGDIKKALEYQKDLKSTNCNPEKTINKDLLIARLYNNSSRREDAFDLLLQLKENKELDTDQQVQLNLLLAKSYDYKEEDKLAFEISNGKTKKLNCMKNWKMNLE